MKSREPGAPENATGRGSTTTTTMRRAGGGKEEGRHEGRQKLFSVQNRSQHPIAVDSTHSSRGGRTPALLDRKRTGRKSDGGYVWVYMHDEEDGVEGGGDDGDGDRGRAQAPPTTRPPSVLFPRRRP